MTGRSPRHARYDGRGSSAVRKSQRDAWCSTNYVRRLPPWHPPALQARRRKADVASSQSRWCLSPQGRDGALRAHLEPLRSAIEIGWFEQPRQLCPTNRREYLREIRQWCTGHRRHGHEPRFPPLQDDRLRPPLKRGDHPWQASPQHVERA